MHQRTRIGKLDSDLLESDSDPLGHYPSKNLKDDLKDYDPVSEMDSNLVRGTLFEKGIVPSNLQVIF